MTRSQLADMLVSAKTSAERKRLLTQNLPIADVALAQEIKEICYRAWASQPVIAQKASRAADALASFSGNREIAAYAEWLAGISWITKGKLETAIVPLKNASAIFKQLGDEHEAAQPLVALLMALAMIGKYDEALKTGMDALAILEKFGDDLAAGKIEMNLSNIVSRRGLHRQAQKFCQSACSRFIKLKEYSWQAMAENGLANTYAELNDFRAAESYYAAALKTARSAEMAVTEAEIEASLGNLALFRGRYAEALRFLETSRSKYEALGMPHQTAIAELEIADIYLELNMAAEALAIYERLATVLKKLRLRGEEARARANFGRAAALLKKRRTACRQLELGGKLFDAEGNKNGKAFVLLSRARLDLESGAPSDALIVSRRAAGLFDQMHNQRGQLTAQLIGAEAVFAMGDHPAADAAFREIVSRASALEQVEAARLALNSLGKIASQTGRPGDAEKFFARSIALAETARKPLPGEEFRISFLADKLEPFDNLAKLYISQGRIADAFEIVERSRSRALLDAMSERSDSTPAEKASGAQAETHAELREELNWYYSRMDRADPGESVKIGAKIKRLEKQLSVLARRESSVTKGDQASAKEGIDWAGLYKKLGSRALIEYMLFDGEISAFVVTKESLKYISLGVTEETITQLIQGLHFQFGSLRYGGPTISSFSKQLKQRADGHLQQLYQLLVAPLAESVENRDLVISPAGALHYVPFHALMSDGQYLVENSLITYIPAASVWTKLETAAPRGPDKALLIGYADSHIPLVNKEIRSLEKLFTDPKVLLDSDATFEAFSEAAGKFDLLHIACHGTFRPDNPLFSSLHLADGWITVRDLTAKRIKARLVTLSACESGVNEVVSGEEILGLSRGFLAAGAASLVLTLWTVNDEAAMKLMRMFYEGLQRGGTIASSLRDAQISFIENGEHPYYWSPFVLIGGD